MRNRESLFKFEFILYHLLWLIVITLFVTNTFFLSLLDFTYYQSRFILLLLMIISAFNGWLLALEANQDALTAFSNVFVGFEIYFVLAYYKYYPIRITILICAIVILSVMFNIIVFRKNILGIAKKKISKKKLYYALNGTRNILSICIIVAMLPNLMRALLGFAVFNANVEPAVLSSYDENTISENFSTIVGIHEEEWIFLDLQERLDVMQSVANIESTYLGLPHPLKVGAGSFKNNSAAQYNDNKHTITFEISFLETATPYESLNLLCHEAYHAYQNRQMDLYETLSPEQQKLYMFNDIRKYKEEYEDGYKAPQGDFKSYLEYSNQLIELKSYEYGKEGAAKYYLEVN